VRRAVGAVALVVGAVLAVLGSLLPLFEQVFAFSAEPARFSMSLWGFESSFDDRTGPEVLLGVPVVVAAALLVVSAVLLLAGPRLPAGFARPASISALASAALLTGAVWGVGQLVLVVMTANRNDGNVTTNLGAGSATLGLACLVSLVGGVLVQSLPEAAASTPEPEPEGAVVYRLPDDDEDGGG
jgi:hypothetical protein